MHLNYVANNDTFFFKRSLSLAKCWTAIMLSKKTRPSLLLLINYNVPFWRRERLLLRWLRNQSFAFSSRAACVRWGKPLAVRTSRALAVALHCCHSRCRNASTEIIHPVDCNTAAVKCYISLKTSLLLATVHYSIENVKTTVIFHTLRPSEIYMTRRYLQKPLCLRIYSWRQNY